MKTVFSSNSELAHVWAKQSQFEGRANNMFFKRDEIYSYGYHYMIAKIIPEKNACFINSMGYSNSTSKHTSNVASATRVQGYKCFYVPFNGSFRVDLLPLYVERLKEDVENLLDKQSRARSSNANWFFALSKINQVIEICELFNLPVPLASSYKNFEKAQKNTFLSHGVQENQ